MAQYVKACQLKRLRCRVLLCGRGGRAKFVALKPFVDSSQHHPCTSHSYLTFPRPVCPFNIRSVRRVTIDQCSKQRRSTSMYQYKTILVFLLPLSFYNALINASNCTNRFHRKFHFSINNAN